ncbi:MAG: hypothetical protein R3A79_19700 [Nannocystaceae bacterium]
MAFDRPLARPLACLRLHLRAAAAAVAAAGLTLGAAACSGDDGQASATEGSTTTTGDTSTSTSTTGDASTSTAGETTASETTGGACEAEAPFALNLASDADTYGTCDVPFQFFAKRKAGTLTVERCTDDTCASCDPNLAYDLDFGSSTAVPEEMCLTIDHETKTDAGACRSRGFVIARVDQEAPLVIGTAITPESPSAVEAAGLSASAVDERSCSCDAADDWCCGGSVQTHSVEFVVDGGDTVTVAPGLANFKQIAFANFTYEAVVTQAYTPCDSDAPRTGWYLRRL